MAGTRLRASPDTSWPELPRSSAWPGDRWMPMTPVLCLLASKGEADGPNQWVGRVNHDPLWPNTTRGTGAVACLRRQAVRWKGVNLSQVDASCLLAWIIGDEPNAVAAGAGIAAETVARAARDHVPLWAHCRAKAGVLPEVLLLFHVEGSAVSYALRVGLSRPLSDCAHPEAWTIAILSNTPRALPLRTCARWRTSSIVSSRGPGRGSTPDEPPG